MGTSQRVERGFASLIVGSMLAAMVLPLFKPDGKVLNIFKVHSLRAAVASILV